MICDEKFHSMIVQDIAVCHHMPECDKLDQSPNIIDDNSSENQCKNYINIVLSGSPVRMDRLKPNKFTH